MGLTESIWLELPNGAPKDDKWSLASSVIRRNLQREHIKALSELVLGQRPVSDRFLIFFGDPDSSAPPDARSLARLHLGELGKRISSTLTYKRAVGDEATRAHLEECNERIAKVLSASMQLRD